MDPTERKSSIFVRQDSRTSAALNRQGRPSEDFDPYAEAYRRAAQALFREHFTPQTKHDLDALPICFNYRHAAELYLKGIARRGNVLLPMNGRPEVNVRRSHHLTALMDEVRPVFAFLGIPWDVEHRGQPSLADVRRCFADLERDDALGLDDTGGDMWRYPVRAREDRAHLPFHFEFDVAEFVKRVEPALDVLAWATYDLDDQLWNLRAMMLGLDHHYRDGYLFMDWATEE